MRPSVGAIIHLNHDDARKPPDPQAALPQHQNLSRRLGPTSSSIPQHRGRWSIQLFPKAATAPSEGEARSITGHIDFLQIRNGAIHILDYKPDATTGKPFAQLTLYALALSHLTGIPLFDFKCAWFNERQYCEFFPRTVLARKITR